MVIHNTDKNNSVVAKCKLTFRFHQSFYMILLPHKLTYMDIYKLCPITAKSVRHQRKYRSTLCRGASLNSQRVAMIIWRV